MIKRLSTGIFYQDSYFREDIEETKLNVGNYSEFVERWDDKDQYQLYHEALDWLGFRQNEIVELSFKAQQWSVQQGIRKFGDEGKKSAMKEIKNLAVKNNCFGEVDYKPLSQEQKDKALPILMFMVKKRNGDIKTRGCANGSVQRIYTDKNSVSSPTPDFYAFKYVCTVIAKEGRDVATVDLPGFFLQTDQDGEEEILLKLTGAVALLLVESDEEKWKKHVVQENGKCTIYVLCNKAIYGTINAALLVYRKLAKLFKSWGLIMNPYDPWVWNKDVNGEQLTIMFHIDYLLLAHVQASIITESFGS